MCIAHAFSSYFIKLHITRTASGKKKPKYLTQHHTKCNMFTTQTQIFFTLNTHHYALMIYICMINRLIGSHVFFPLFSFSSFLCICCAVMCLNVIVNENLLINTMKFHVIFFYNKVSDYMIACYKLPDVCALLIVDVYCSIWCLVT